VAARQRAPFADYIGDSDTGPLFPDTPRKVDHGVMEFHMIVTGQERKGTIALTGF
jgi:hypothetical protein